MEHMIRKISRSTGSGGEPLYLKGFFVMSSIKSFTYTLACLVCLCMLATTYGSEAVKDGLIFYAPMDGSAAATEAKGDPDPVKARDVSFVDGKFGKAVLVKDKAHLRYRGGANFQFAQGTVAMWIKSNKPWNSGMKLFFKGWADDWNRNSIYIQTTAYSQLRVWLWSAEKEQTTVRSPNGISYKADQWYHLAVTFTDGQVKVYVDGQEISYGVASDATLEMPLAELKYFMIGCDYTPDAVLDGAIDELRIYNKPLDADGIKQLHAYVPQ